MIIQYPTSVPILCQPWSDAGDRREDYFCWRQVNNSHVDDASENEAPMHSPEPASSNCLRTAVQCQQQTSQSNTGDSFLARSSPNLIGPSHAQMNVVLASHESTFPLAKRSIIDEPTSQETNHRFPSGCRRGNTDRSCCHQRSAEHRYVGQPRRRTYSYPLAKQSHPLFQIHRSQLNPKACVRCSTSRPRAAARSTIRTENENQYSMPLKTGQKFIGGLVDWVRGLFSASTSRLASPVDDRLHSSDRPSRRRRRDSTLELSLSPTNSPVATKRFKNIRSPVSSLVPELSSSVDVSLDIHLPEAGNEPMSDASSSSTDTSPQTFCTAIQASLMGSTYQTAKEYTRSVPVIDNTSTTTTNDEGRALQPSMEAYSEMPDISISLIKAPADEKVFNQSESLIDTRVITNEYKQLRRIPVTDNSEDEYMDDDLTEAEYRNDMTNATVDNITTGQTREPLGGHDQYVLKKMDLNYQPKINMGNETQMTDHSRTAKQETGEENKELQTQPLITRNSGGSPGAGGPPPLPNKSDAQCKCPVINIQTTFEWELPLGNAEDDQLNDTFNPIVSTEVDTENKQSSSFHFSIDTTTAGSDHRFDFTVPSMRETTHNKPTHDEFTNNEQLGSHLTQSEMIDNNMEVEVTTTNVNDTISHTQIRLRQYMPLLSPPLSPARLRLAILTETHAGEMDTQPNPTDCHPPADAWVNSEAPPPTPECNKMEEHVGRQWSLDYGSTVLLSATSDIEDREEEIVTAEGVQSATTRVLIQDESDSRTHSETKHDFPENKDGTTRTQNEEDAFEEGLVLEEEEVLRLTHSSRKSSEMTPQDMAMVNEVQIPYPFTTEPVERSQEETTVLPRALSQLIPSDDNEAIATGEQEYPVLNLCCCIRAKKSNEGCESDGHAVNSQCFSAPEEVIENDISEMDDGASKPQTPPDAIAPIADATNKLLSQAVQMDQEPYQEQPFPPAILAKTLSSNMELPNEDDPLSVETGASEGVVDNDVLSEIEEQSAALGAKSPIYEDREIVGQLTRPQEIPTSSELDPKSLLEVEIENGPDDRVTVMATNSPSTNIKSLEHLDSEKQPYHENPLQLAKPTESNANVEHREVAGNKILAPSSVPQDVIVTDQLSDMECPVAKGTEAVLDVAATHNITPQKQLHTEPFEGLKSKFTVTPIELILIHGSGSKQTVLEEQPYNDEAVPSSFVSQDILPLFDQVNLSVDTVIHKLDFIVPEEVIKTQSDMQIDEPLQSDSVITKKESDNEPGDASMVLNVEEKPTSNLSEQQMHAEEQSCPDQLISQPSRAGNMDLADEYNQVDGSRDQTNVTEQLVTNSMTPEHDRPAELWLTISSQREPDNIAQHESVHPSDEQPMRVVLTEDVEMKDTPHEVQQFTETRTVVDVNISVEVFHDEPKDRSPRETMTNSVAKYIESVQAVGSDEVAEPMYQPVNCLPDTKADLGNETGFSVELPLSISPTTRDNVHMDISPGADIFNPRTQIDSPGISVTVTSVITVRPNSPTTGETAFDPNATFADIERPQSVQMDATINVTIVTSPANLQTTHYIEYDQLLSDMINTPIEDGNAETGPRIVMEQLPTSGLDSHTNFQSLDALCNPENVEMILIGQTEETGREERKTKKILLPGDPSLINFHLTLDQPLRSATEPTDEISSGHFEVNTSLLPEQGSNLSIRSENNEDFEQLIPVDLPACNYIVKWSDDGHEVVENRVIRQVSLEDSVRDRSVHRSAAITLSGTDELEHSAVIPMNVQESIIPALTSVTQTTDESIYDEVLTRSEKLDQSYRSGESEVGYTHNDPTTILSEEPWGYPKRQSSHEMQLGESNTLAAMTDNEVIETRCNRGSINEVIVPATMIAYDVEVNHEPVSLEQQIPSSISPIHSDPAKSSIPQKESVMSNEPATQQPMQQQLTQMSTLQDSTAINAQLELRQETSPHDGKPSCLVEISWNIKYMRSPDAQSENIRHPEIQVRYEAQLMEVEENRMMTEMVVHLDDDQFRPRCDAYDEPHDRTQSANSNRGPIGELDVAPYDDDEQLFQREERFALDATEITDYEQTNLSENLPFCQYDEEWQHSIEDVDLVKRLNCAAKQTLPRQMITLPLGEMPSISDTRSDVYKTRQPGAVITKPKRLYCGETLSLESVHRDVKKLQSYAIPPEYQQYIAEEMSKNQINPYSHTNVPYNISHYLSQPAGLDRPNSIDDDNNGENKWLSEGSVADTTRPGSSVSLPNYAELSEMKTPLVFQKHYTRPCRYDRSCSRDNQSVDRAASSTAARPSSPFDWSHASTMFPDDSNTPASSDSALPTSPAGIRLAQSVDTPARQKHDPGEQCSPNNQIDEANALRGFCNSNLPQQADDQDRTRSQSCPRSLRSQIGQVQITISQRICRCGMRSGQGGSSTEVTSPGISCVVSPEPASDALWSPTKLKSESDSEIDTEQIRRKSETLTKEAIHKAANSLVGSHSSGNEQSQDGDPTSVGRVERVGISCTANIAASVDVTSEVRSPITVSRSTKPEEGVQPGPTNSALGIRTPCEGEEERHLPEHRPPSCQTFEANIRVHTTITPTKVRPNSPMSGSETDLGIFTFSSPSQKNGIEISTKIGIHFITGVETDPCHTNAKQLTPGSTTEKPVTPTEDHKTSAPSVGNVSPWRIDERDSYEDAVRLIEDHPQQLPVSSDMKNMTREPIVVTPPIATTETPMESQTLLPEEVEEKEGEPVSTREKTLKAEESEAISDTYTRIDDSAPPDVKPTVNEIEFDDLAKAETPPDGQQHLRLQDEGSPVPVADTTTSEELAIAETPLDIQQQPGLQEDISTSRKIIPETDKSEEESDNIQQEIPTMRASSTDIISVKADIPQGSKQTSLDPNIINIQSVDEISPAVQELIPVPSEELPLSDLPVEKQPAVEQRRPDGKVLHFISDIKILDDPITTQSDEIKDKMALMIAPSIEVNTETFIEKEDGKHQIIEREGQTTKMQGLLDEYTDNISFKHAITSGPVMVGNYEIEVVQEFKIATYVNEANQVAKLNSSKHEANKLEKSITTHMVVKFVEQEPTKQTGELTGKAQEVPGERRASSEVVEHPIEVGEQESLCKELGIIDSELSSKDEEKSEGKLEPENLPENIHQVLDEEHVLDLETEIDPLDQEIKMQSPISAEEVQISTGEPASIDAGKSIILDTTPDEQSHMTIACETPTVGQQEKSDLNEAIDYQAEPVDIDAEKQQQQVYITTPSDEEHSPPSATELPATIGEQQTTQFDEAEIMDVEQESRTRIEGVAVDDEPDQQAVTQVKPEGQASEKTGPTTPENQQTERMELSTDEQNDHRLASTEQIDEIVVPVESDMARVPSQVGLATEDKTKAAVSESEGIQKSSITSTEAEIGENLGETVVDSPADIKPEQEGNLAETTETESPKDNLIEAVQDSQVGEQSEALIPVASTDIKPESPQTTEQIETLVEPTSTEALARGGRHLDHRPDEKTLNYISEVKISSEPVMAEQIDEINNERHMVLAPSIEVNTETFITTADGTRIPVDNAGKDTQLQGGFEESEEYPAYLSFQHHVTSGPIIVDGNEVEIVQEFNILIDVRDDNPIIMLRLNDDKEAVKVPQSIKTHVQVHFGDSETVQQSAMPTAEHGARVGIPDRSNEVSEHQTIIQSAAAVEVTEEPSAQAVDVTVDQLIENKAEIHDQPVGQVGEQAQEIGQYESPSKLADDSKLEQQASTDAAADTLAAAETIPFTETMKSAGQPGAPEDTKGELTEGGVGGEPTGAVTESDVMKPDGIALDERSVTEADDGTLHQVDLKTDQIGEQPPGMPGDAEGAPSERSGGEPAEAVSESDALQPESMVVDERSVTEAAELLGQETENEVIPLINLKTDKTEEQQGVPEDMKDVDGEPKAVAESAIPKSGTALDEERSIAEASGLLGREALDKAVYKLDAKTDDTEEQQAGEMSSVQPMIADQFVTEITITMTPGQAPQISVKTKPGNELEQAKPFDNGPNIFQDGSHERLVDNIVPVVVNEVLRQDVEEKPRAITKTSTVGSLPTTGDNTPIDTKPLADNEIPIAVPITETRSSDHSRSPEDTIGEEGGTTAVVVNRETLESDQISSQTKGGVTGESPVVQTTVLGQTTEQTGLPGTNAPADIEPQQAANLAETAESVSPKDNLSQARESTQASEQAEMPEPSTSVEITPEQAEVLDSAPSANQEIQEQSNQLVHRSENIAGEVNEEQHINVIPSIRPIKSNELMTEIVVTLEDGQTPQVTVQTIPVRLPEEGKSSNTERVTPVAAGGGHNAVAIEPTGVAIVGQEQAEEQTPGLFMEGTTASGQAHAGEHQPKLTQEAGEAEGVTSAPTVPGYTSSMDENGVNPPAERELPTPTMVPEFNELRRSQGMLAGLKDMNAQDLDQLERIEPGGQQAEMTSQEIIDADQVVANAQYNEDSDRNEIDDERPTTSDTEDHGADTRTAVPIETEQVDMYSKGSEGQQEPFDAPRAVTQVESESEMILEPGQSDDDHEVPRDVSVLESISKFELRPGTDELELRIPEDDEEESEQVEADTTALGVIPDTQEETTIADTQKQTDTHIPTQSTVTTKVEVRPAGEVPTHGKTSRDYTEPTALTSELRSVRRKMRTDEDSDSLDRHFNAMMKTQTDTPVDFMHSVRNYCAKQKTTRRRAEVRVERTEKVAGALDALIQETILSLKKKLNEH